MKRIPARDVQFGLSLVMIGVLLWSAIPVKTIQAEPNIKDEFFSFNPPAAPATRNKLALLVGIKNYDRGTKDSKGKPLADYDWWDLNTEGDLELIATQLIDKFEYKPENIKILSDVPVTVKGQTIPPVKQVTHKLIIDTFRAFLVDRAQSTDVVYFHFSGHGQQVPDNNSESKDRNGNAIVPANDELDGMDETIIPQDYVSQKDGSKNIRDDEIAVLLNELSKKNPSNVTITLDSCFSGTATRGDLPPRGGPWKGKIPEKTSAADPDETFADFVARGGGTRGNSAGGQNYVFISAASSRQTAKEAYKGQSPNLKAYGAFSYALAEAMEKSNKNTTNRDLFDKISDIITRTQRDQNPQIEGTQLDKIVMEDGALPPQKFVGVKIARGIPYLTAGRLQGITKGSKFNLCPSAAKECKESEKLALGEVTAVNPTTSLLKVEGNVPPEKLKNVARAFEVFHSYEDVLRVAVRENTRGGQNLDSVFSNLGIIKKNPGKR